jgi:hypothetical protein
MNDNVYDFRFGDTDREVRIKQRVKLEEDNIYKAGEVFIALLRALEYSDEVIDKVIRLEEFDF